MKCPTLAKTERLTYAATAAYMPKKQTLNTNQQPHNDQLTQQIHLLQQQLNTLTQLKHNFLPLADKSKLSHKDTQQIAELSSKLPQSIQHQPSTQNHTLAAPQPTSSPQQPPQPPQPQDIESYLNSPQGKKILISVIEQICKKNKIVTDKNKTAETKGTNQTNNATASDSSCQTLR